MNEVRVWAWYPGRQEAFQECQEPSPGPCWELRGGMVGRVVVSAFAEAARAKKKFSSEPFRGEPGRVSGPPVYQDTPMTLGARKSRV